MKLSEAGELGLLHELESRGLIEGTEHDAAELAGGLVVTQDALVEGVHFRLDWLSWRELGFRAAAVNISDLAASAAKPEALLVTLALPGDVDVESVVELYEGLAEAGVPVRGGDTTRADQVVVSVTALGRSERVPGRAGARPGDAIVVTGPLGAAGAAFREGALPPPAAARRGGTPARPRRHRDARRLGRGRRRRRPPRPPLRLPGRDRPRRRPARRHDRRPRLRRGLRAARRRPPSTSLVLGTR